MPSQDDDTSVRCASPPCFMHELDETYTGIASETAARLPQDVARWRKSERDHLIADRLGIEPELRKSHAASIIKKLEAIIGNPIGYVVSGYWPFRGEPDLRPWIEKIHARGGQFALPVVVERHKPLVFRLWAPGAPLKRGVWNIPIPDDGAEEVIPDIVIAPVVGFDARCFRLGYGGGFFDRTLELIGRREKILGVGYARQAIRTIHPAPHDIPMDAVVTEQGTIYPPGQ